MFFDERIQSESGRIYQRGILFATLITFFYAVLRAIPLVRDGDFALRLFTTELFIILAGIGILLYALIRFRGEGDERALKEKHDYFVKAGWGFLIAALAGYAFAIVFSADRGTHDAPTNYLVLMLELLGVTYFFYAFKSRDISFNYSFIGEARYYRRVFLNMAKLAAILAVPFFFAAWLDLFVHESALYFWSILFGYLLSIIGLSVSYFYISVIERLSYADESACLLKRGTRVSMAVYFAVFVISVATDVLYRYLVTERGMQGNHGGALGLSLGQLAQTFSYLGLYFQYLLAILQTISLCHLLSAMLSSRLAKDIIGFRTAFGALSILWTMFLRFFLTSGFTQVGEDAWWALTYLSNGASQIFLWGGNILLFVLFISLWREFRVHGFICFLPILHVLSFLIMLILDGISLFALSKLLDGILGSVFYIAFYALLRARDKRVS